MLLNDSSFVKSKHVSFKVVSQDLFSDPFISKNNDVKS